MKNSKFTILSQITIAFGFIIIFIGNNTIAAPQSTDLDNLVQIIGKHHGTITEWSLYARESVYLPSEEDWLVKKYELEDQFPNMNWKLSNGNGTYSIIGIMDHGKFSETVQILSADKNRQRTSYLVYEAKGENWNPKYAELTGKTVLHLFEGNPKLFSCIKGEFSEELHEFVDFSLDGLLHSLQASEVESVKEQEFYSISAFSSLFAQTLSFTEKQMNMQIGLRKNEMGQGMTFVVGTPILTIEY
ncbi:YwmB family TATA-box binding protein [Bacillus sp. FJAT-49732]|uniref:YwmB family TATA-box binding protein n=1 Tax=Lederbergia citrisecunda TaxID=2833583 RepID=A0A942YKR7_9BACI|nr:YwmB family TATA-box binding protein [Lederbergia citrisecunda]MBS4200688.1 YwmB family TATA-box binding protein [Lederbergia citrisecunda]